MMYQSLTALKDVMDWRSFKEIGNLVWDIFLFENVSRYAAASSMWTFLVSVNSGLYLGKVAYAMGSFYVYRSTNKYLTIKRLETTNLVLNPNIVCDPFSVEFYNRPMDFKRAFQVAALMLWDIELQIRGWC